LTDAAIGQVVQGEQIGHDPDGTLWVTADQWKSAEWDGIPYNPEKMTREELGNAICPNYPTPTVRGVRELFYQHNPFADKVHPTKAEVDNWHSLVLNHLRALLGIKYPIEQDHCLTIAALWGNERSGTTKWDQGYPAKDSDVCFGPCDPKADVCGGHCGSTFIPSQQDQAPYLDGWVSECDGHCEEGEGRFGCPVTYPWFAKMLNSWCNSLMDEGFWGGHNAPFWRRGKFGFDFFLKEGEKDQGAWTAKWGGEEFPLQYTDPR